MAAVVWIDFPFLRDTARIAAESRGCGLVELLNGFCRGYDFAAGRGGGLRLEAFVEMEFEWLHLEVEVWSWRLLTVVLHVHACTCTCMSRWYMYITCMYMYTWGEKHM